MDNRGRTLCLITVLVCLLDGTASGGQTTNPTASDPTTQQTAGVTKKLPTCQVQLAACKNTLKSTQRQLARCSTNLNTCANDLEDCQTDLDACEAEPRVVVPGDGYSTTPEERAVGIDHGPALIYTVNGDGTFTDNNTQLMWEMKDAADGVRDFSNPHDVNNLYTWTDTGDGNPENPDGTLFLTFLTTLNNPPCFAGHCDWRIPTVRELQSIVDYSKGDLDSATSVPGATAASTTWSSTSEAKDISSSAWAVYFFHGDVNDADKSQALYARTVRGGQ